MRRSNLLPVSWTARTCAKGQRVRWPSYVASNCLLGDALLPHGSENGLGQAVLIRGLFIIPLLIEEP